MNRFVLFLLTFAALMSFRVYSEPEKPQVYLLIGQSNMAGRAPVEAGQEAPIERCVLLDDKDSWEPASNPLNRHSTIRKGLGMQKVNPGYSFARTMLAADESISLGLVVNAKGGSSIKEWKKGDRFYNEAVRRTRAAMKIGDLKGILWHQGESDQNDAEYLAKLKTLIADLRKDLGVAELPFVAGQVNKVDLINEQIARLPAEVPFTGFASSEGLTCMDRWHFDAKSMKTLGERYAEAMLKLQNKPVVLFNGVDLSGWVRMHEGDWAVEDGVLVGRKGVKWTTNPKVSGSWLRTEKEYADFVFEFEYAINKKGNSGVFLRSGLEENPAFTGHEMQILDDHGLEKPETWSTGALYDVVAAKKNMSKPPGEWNSVKIETDGPRIQVWFNGEQIVDHKSDRRTKGYLGLQNHDEHAVVKYRNLRITEK